MFALLYLGLIAFLTGWFVDTIAQDQMPGKLWGTVFAAFIGGLIGGFFPAFNHIGINIAGVALLPAFIGDIIALIVMVVVKFVIEKIIRPDLQKEEHRGKESR